MPSGLAVRTCMSRSTVPETRQAPRTSFTAVSVLCWLIRLEMRARFRTYLAGIVLLHTEFKHPTVGPLSLTRVGHFADAHFQTLAAAVVLRAQCCASSQNRKLIVLPICVIRSRNDHLRFALNRKGSWQQCAQCPFGVGKCGGSLRVCRREFAWAHRVTKLPQLIHGRLQVLHAGRHVLPRLVAIDAGADGIQGRIPWLDY